MPRVVKDAETAEDPAAACHGGLAELGLVGECFSFLNFSYGSMGSFLHDGSMMDGLGFFAPHGKAKVAAIGGGHIRREAKWTMT